MVYLWILFCWPIGGTPPPPLGRCERWCHMSAGPDCGACGGPLWACRVLAGPDCGAGWCCVSAGPDCGAVVVLRVGRAWLWGRGGVACRQGLIDAHEQFKQTLGEADKEYAAIMGLVSEVQRLAQQFGISGGKDNPYSTLVPQVSGAFPSPSPLPGRERADGR